MKIVLRDDRKARRAWGDKKHEVTFDYFRHSVLRNHLRKRLFQHRRRRTDRSTRSFFDSWWWIDDGELTTAFVRHHNSNAAYFFWFVALIATNAAILFYHLFLYTFFFFTIDNFEKVYQQNLPVYQKYHVMYASNQPTLICTHILISRMYLLLDTPMSPL